MYNMCMKKAIDSQRIMCVNKAQDLNQGTLLMINYLIK